MVVMTGVVGVVWQSGRIAVVMRTSFYLTMVITVMNARECNCDSEVYAE